MKFKFLGTAAAEGIPALFCNCDVCKEAARRGGCNIRTRCQAIINGKFLIDFGPDTYMHKLKYNLDLSKIEHCLITHTHEDHLYVSDIAMRMPGYAHLSPDTPPLTIHGLYGAILFVNGGLNAVTHDPRGAVDLKWIGDLYTPEQIGDYKVTALAAIHGPATFPVFYLIEDKCGKRVLYAHDTNYFCDEVWEYFEKNPVHLDLVSLDCTQANDPEMRYIGHMNLNDNIKVKERLTKLGCADEKTIFVSNHFSHNGNDVLYEEFSAIAEKSGILASFDGMEIEI